MTDEYWKNRAKELEQQHHQPAHETQRVGQSLDDVLKGLPGQPRAPQQDSSGWAELSQNQVMTGLMKKIAAGNTQGIGFNASQGPSGAIPGSHPSPTTCFVREGVAAYRRLQTPMTEVAIAMAIGPTSGVNGREFEYKGVKNVYLIKNQNETLDMGNLDKSKIIRLVEISAPFIGSLLVPESAVFHKGQKTGQQVLND